MSTKLTVTNKIASVLCSVSVLLKIYIDIVILALFFENIMEYNLCRHISSYTLLAKNLCDREYI